MQQNEIYIVIDFSQNHICKYNKEIQALHFGASQKQISFQTGGVYYVDDSNKIKLLSFSAFSDCLRHDAVTVWALLTPVI